MSQEKVDKYKQEKANRKKTMAKEKRKKKMYIALGVLIGLAFIVWIVCSVFLEIKQAEDESRQQSEFMSMYEEYIQQQATATTGSGETTTGSGETTTGTDETTTGTDETTTGTEETTTGTEETTTGSKDKE